MSRSARKWAGYASVMSVASVLALAGCKENVPTEARAEPPSPVISAPATSAPASRDRVRFVVTKLKLAESEVVRFDLCALRVNKQNLKAPPLQVNSEEPVEITGWMGDDSTMSWPEEQPVLLLEHASTGARVWRLDIMQPIERRDVARGLAKETMLLSGFALNADLSAVPQGNYRLYAGFGNGNKLHICHRGGALTITG